MAENKAKTNNKRYQNQQQLEDSSLTEEEKSLLPKLRPFQKEAYLFTTQGNVSKRLRQPSQSNDNNDDSSFSYDPSLLGKGRILLADEMGLGKTVTSLAIMAHYKSEWPLLILCPASLRHTWPAEIEKFLPTIPPSSIYVLNGFNDVDFVNRRDIQVVVATYSLLQSRSAVAQLLISNKLKFQCVIADESHNLKTKNSQRSKIALPILQNAKRLLLLSGTPALAKPVELWLQLHALAPKLFGSYSAYTKTYCNARFKFGHMDVSGVSNAKELHHKIRQVMVRRLKCDVLQELPAKQRTVVPIKINDKTMVKANQQLMKELKETRTSIAELVGDDQRSASFEAKSMFMQAYQASGVAKAQAVADYLVDWIAGAGTQKVLVFAHHKAVMDTLELAISKQLKGVGHIRIDGSVPSNERAKMVRKFQTSAQVRVALLSMTAAGVGLTLTAASNVMFAELHFTPGVLAQAEDRAHRIGQRNAVNIMYFVCKDTSISLDSQIWQLLGRKIGTLERVIDGGSGKERKALAAKEVEGGSNKPRQSVQEELTSFFADTANAEKTPAKIAVKGSILSFFKKTSAPSSAAKSSADSNPKEVTPSGSATKQSTDDIVEWACEACTFVNSKKRKAYLACEMCKAMYVQDLEPAPLVTPKERLKRGRDGRKTPKSNGIAAARASNHNTPNIKGVKSASNPSSSVDLVVIDDDDESSPPLSRSGSKRKRAPPQTVVIDLDADETSKMSSGSKRPRAKPAASKVLPKEVLLFSVSQNSGRLTIHYASKDGLSSFVNLDIHDILTEETVDALSEAQTKRSTARSNSTNLCFKQGEIESVVKKLDSAISGSRANRKQACSEIKGFVTSYLSLREIERKAIKGSSEEAFSSRGLAQAAARIMTQALAKNTQVATSSTERYTGGAKERAKERLNDGTATRQDMGVLKGENCAWCAGNLSAASRKAEAVYCSQRCSEEGRIRRGGMFTSSNIRDQAFALEGGVCQLCKLDAHALFLRVKALPPAQRLSALCNVNWKLPTTHQAMEKLLQDPKAGSFWQVDHIKAVAEGGGGTGMENLRTLCVPCHIQETANLRKRLKLDGGKRDSSMGDAITASKGKQLDIRSMFACRSQK